METFLFYFFELGSYIVKLFFTIGQLTFAAVNKLKFSLELLLFLLETPLEPYQVSTTLTAIVFGSSSYAHSFIACFLKYFFMLVLRFSQ
jgi:hypothetical protein